MGSTLASKAEGVEGFSAQELAPAHILEAPLRLTRQMYDIAPDWIPVFFSNQGLAPWHGGCAWICQKEKTSSPIAFFQLRKPFAHRLRYLGIYQRDELVAHELSHIGRMTFQEPVYEEILAFRTATSKFRRWFGPILLSSTETMMFFLILCLLLFVDVALLSQPNAQALEISLWLKIIPLALVGYGLVRLASRQRRFHSCRRRLTALFESETVADSVMYRLTDDEIDRFATYSPKEVLRYVQDAAKNSLRWRLLVIAYFQKTAIRSCGVVAHSPFGALPGTSPRYVAHS